MTKKLSTIEIGILVLALATGLIHLVLLNIRMGKLDILFTLNGLGYLGLLAAYFLPLPIVKNYHGLLRWAFMGFALLTIIAWLLANGDKGPLGIVTKLIEVALIAFLWMDKT